MIPKFGSDVQRRLFIALDREWRPARELAEIAGVPLKGAGTALVALEARGHAERRATGQRLYEYRRSP